MNDVNWWLMALSFLLGLALTLAFMVKRVTREVPIYGALGRGPGVEAARLSGGTNGKTPDVTAHQPEADAGPADLDTNAPDEDATGADAASVAVAGTEATFAGGGSADSEGEVEEPYGTGSLRLASGAGVPSGYTIKGNEDSMLYHTAESPSYEQTITEVWFIDEATAEKAGFTRWDNDQGV
jgi:uncharacterized membrane protein ArfC